MTDRDLTDELAEALRRALELKPQYADPFIRRALDRYDQARSRGESEMTGTAFLDGDNFCPEGDQPSWTFVPSCRHQPDAIDSETRPARLVIFPTPETDR